MKMLDALRLHGISGKSFIGSKNIERTGTQQLHGLVNFEDPDLLQRCFKKTKVLAKQGTDRIL